MNYKPNTPSNANIDDFHKQIIILKKNMLKFINKHQDELPLLVGYIDDLHYLLNDYLDCIALGMQEFAGDDWCDDFENHEI